MRESEANAIVDAFHQLYYNSLVWDKTTWMGVPLCKCPLDLWLYQEIIFAHRPTVIIETGTYRGGSALYLANLCDLLGEGRVLTIDIQSLPRPVHPRIQYLLGSSTSPAIFAAVQAQLTPEDRVMVILDSDHSQAHVLQELELYHRLVTPGQYLIVEDGNINGHPVCPESGPGPLEAVQTFLAQNHPFVVDELGRKFFLSFNPSGYLRRYR